MPHETQVGAASSCGARTQVGAAHKLQQSAHDMLLRRSHACTDAYGGRAYLHVRHARTCAPQNAGVHACICMRTRAGCTTTVAAVWLAILASATCMHAHPCALPHCGTTPTLACVSFAYTRAATRVLVQQACATGALMQQACVRRCAPPGRHKWRASPPFLQNLAGRTRHFLQSLCTLPSTFCNPCAHSPPLLAIPVHTPLHFLQSLWHTPLHFLQSLCAPVHSPPTPLHQGRTRRSLLGSLSAHAGPHTGIPKHAHDLRVCPLLHGRHVRV